MADGTKIIPLTHPTVHRRTVATAAPRRPDMQSVLDMLRTIDPELIARFAPQAAPDHAALRGAEPAMPNSAPRGLLQPPSPANTVPHFPRPDVAARTNTLSALVFPDGSTRILTCTLPHLALTLCRR